MPVSKTQVWQSYVLDLYSVVYYQKCQETH